MVIFTPVLSEEDFKAEQKKYARRIPFASSRTHLFRQRIVNHQSSGRLPHAIRLLECAPNSPASSTLERQNIRFPNSNATINSTRNIPNKTLAIVAAAPAIPVKPSTAAMIAITKNINAQCNMT